jgi:pimeloyl-ACP methyl ester carboxylesterase
MTRPDEFPQAIVEHRIDLGGPVFRVFSSSAPDEALVLSEPRRDEASAPPFVLIHGIGMSHRYFSRLHERLAERGEVHSIDLPGFGGLPKPGTDLDVTEMARGLGHALDRAGIGQAVVVGHSMGAQWAVELGAQRPDLVAGVVAIGPVTDDRHKSLHAQAIALALDSVGEPPSVNAIVFADYLRCGVRWYLAQVRHMIAYPIEERAAALAMPLLVVRGGTDPIAGTDWCRRLRDSAADGTFVTVPGHNHVVQQAAPRSVAAAIEAFVAASVSVRA